MSDAPLPKHWHAAVAATRAVLPWREADGGVLVLGDDFPTQPRQAVLPMQAPAVTAPSAPDVAALATPLLANPLTSPAQQLGEAVHRCLQGLPPMAGPTLQAAAEAKAQAVRKALPWLFVPQSEAEIEVLLPHGGVGRVDRLVPTAEALWVIDFKTGAPSDPVPDAYQAQLRGYAQALQADDATCVLRLGLVWIDAEGGPALVEIPFLA